jgi:hypothetical protein
MARRGDRADPGALGPFDMEGYQSLDGDSSDARSASSEVGSIARASARVSAASSRAAFFGDRSR